MRLVAFLVVCNLFFVFDAKAQNRCPWKTGGELFSIALDHETKKDLTKTQVIEDLLCLKLLLQNYYIAQRDYPKINLIERLDSKIQAATAMSNEALLEEIFALHEGLLDTHVRYRLVGKLKMFASKSEKKVSLKQKLSEDQIHELPKFTYYRPAPLLGKLSGGQKLFIEYFNKHDRNTVIDLRQLGGGDDVYAHALAKVLFTPQQSIPAVTKLQVESPLKDIGLMNLFKILNYRGIEESYQRVKSRYEHSKIADLLPYTLEPTKEVLKGEREIAYKSKIILLIDSGCRSSCETIVEKLLGHPQVKLYGANTGGALRYSNGMTFELPHSRILASLPTLAHIYEMPAAEAEGYAPNVRQDTIDLDQLEFWL